MSGPDVYVASSWRNERYTRVLEALRAAQLTPYDFRDPANSFDWVKSTGLPPRPSFAWFMYALTSADAARAFEHDMHALQTARACLLVLPCGKSAHLELGVAIGRGIPTVILSERAYIEPELMYRGVSLITDDLDAAVTSLRVTLRSAA